MRVTGSDVSLIALTCLAAAVTHAGETDTTKTKPGLYDLLGNATWSERRLELSAGLVDLSVDGVHDTQRALYLSGSAYAISGYRAAGPPAGGLIGLGTSLKTWWGNDDVDVHALAPFAMGVIGAYAHLSDRTRLELSGRVGPGVARVQIEDETRFDFAWLWAMEASVTLVKGDSAGLGLALGYESVHLKDVQQDGPYIALRFGF